MSILNNYQKILQETAKLTSRKVKIVPVTKYADVEQMNELYTKGIATFGESRTESLKIKENTFPNARWHFIGHLQSRKVKDCIGKVQLIHSIDRWKIAKEIDKRSYRQGIITEGLVQVNVAKEESKHGLYVEEVREFIESCSELSNLKLTGLMTMAPICDNPEDVRYVFRNLHDLKQQLNKYGFTNIVDLSMGMTKDYQVALEEGATIIRIGSKIFN
ncbi:YggS family pyridoxal phosphate-dependent enzyme [Proteinivorax tanatarense]|uniref:Pyridoxal phosphate homeostasis protein n=1 Tax=Proteinivorax tanatarense TaxID=1260629 RepID=A0AAU7VPT8_9FIRM